MRDHGHDEAQEREPLTGPDASIVVTPIEAMEVQRLADSLDRIEAGEHPRLRTEDAELASLLRTAGRLRIQAEHLTDSSSFDSYHARSRAYILHSLERDALEQAGGAPEDPRITPLHVRTRQWGRTRWAVVSSAVATAAAAAALFIISLTGAPGGNDGGVDVQPRLGANLTSQSTEAELERIRRAVSAIQEHAARGEPADASLLRTVTESTAAVAKVIETKPQAVSREAVATYLETVNTARTVLETVAPEEGGVGALAAAQVATEGGQLTASRFLENAASTETATPEGTGTAAAGSAAPVSATRNSHHSSGPVNRMNNRAADGHTGHRAAAAVPSSVIGGMTTATARLASTPTKLSRPEMAATNGAVTNCAASAMQMPSASGFGTPRAVSRADQAGARTTSAAVADTDRANPTSTASCGAAIISAMTLADNTGMAWRRRPESTANKAIAPITAARSTLALGCTTTTNKTSAPAATVTAGRGPITRAHNSTAPQTIVTLAPDTAVR